MFNFILGLFCIIFFGGGLINLYFNDRDKVDWKLSFLASIFIIGGIYLMINSDITSGESIVMETGDKKFSKQDTILAGNYEYNIKKIGSENSISQYEYGDKIKANGKFLIFTIKIKNNSNLPLSMETASNAPFYLVNQEKFYEVNRDLSRSLTDNETDGYAYWSRSNFINPGNDSIGYAVFDVPKEIINSDQTQLLVYTDDSAPNDIYLNIK